MKKCIKFLMVVPILFTSSNLYATGESCNTPYVVLPDENFAHQNFSVTNSDRTLWFKFEANFSDMLLYTCEISNLSPFTHALAMNLYLGTCNSMTGLKSQKFEDLPQGERSMTIGNLTIGQTYFLKVTTKGSMANLAAAFINLSSNSAPICVLPKNWC